MNTGVISKIYSLLADILSYPTPELGATVEECIGLLSGPVPKTAAELEKFLARLDEGSLGEMEEAYTSTFDMNPLCSPYAGYYLFGDNHKRSEFLVELKKDYRVYDFSAEGELPDHLAVMLQFLTVLDDEYPMHALIRECMVPALEQMLKAGKKSDSAYIHAVRAAYLTLEHELEKDPSGGAQDV